MVIITIVILKVIAALSLVITAMVLRAVIGYVTMAMSTVLKE